MPAIRRSVEQTITRLALKQLRARASLAGTPQARSDAAQALALLLDYTPQGDIVQACKTALTLNIGCVMVDVEHVQPSLDMLDGSGVHVGMCATLVQDVYNLLKLGLSEIELQAQAVLTPDLNWSPELEQLRATCHSSGALLKIDASQLNISTETLCRLCLEADSLNIDLITVPFELLDVIRSSGHRFTGFKVSSITTLEAAREALNQGAIRLGSENAPGLIEAARAA